MALSIFSFNPDSRLTRSKMSSYSSPSYRYSRQSDHVQTRSNAQRECGVFLQAIRLERFLNR